MPSYSPETLFFDVAVIGAGGAGLRAACAASAAGLSVVVLTKVPPTRSHTVAAQGGINAALGNRLPDRWEWHMYDTLKGSDWLGDQDAIATLCERAPDAIAELEHFGMPFTRDETGHIYQRAYGGQSTEYGKGAPAYRACAVADRTGHSLLHTLYAQAVRQGVHFAAEHVALDLLFDAGRACRGVLAWKLESGELYCFRAHCVIIASGGFGQAWTWTTSSSICTGDGGGMILRAGLPLQDMEFVQFHPTSLYGTGILITEGARGEGAYLRNRNGVRFMASYAPKSMELASRDVIARAMAVEILEGRGCGPKKDHLLLHLDHLDAAMLQAKLPSVLQIARAFARIDATLEPIPVVPAVHYTMGGVPSNAECEVITLSPQGGKSLPVARCPLPESTGNGERGTGNTQNTPLPNPQSSASSPQGGREQPIPGLLAVGEAACNSVHGANRLGCNSLLDLVVFGRLAGERCGKTIRPGAPHAPLAGDALAPALSRFDRLLNARGTTRAATLRKQLQDVMQRHAGIFRDAELLGEGARQLQALWEQFTHDLKVADRSLLWNNDLADAYETDSLLRQAIAAVHSARARTESRGAHCRDDYPQRNDGSWLVHSLAWVSDDGRANTGTRAVRAHHHAGLPVFPPEERNY